MLGTEACRGRLGVAGCSGDKLAFLSLVVLSPSTRVSHHRRPLASTLWISFKPTFTSHIAVHAHTYCLPPTALIEAHSRFVATSVQSGVDEEGREKKKRDENFVLPSTTFQ